MSGFRFFPVSVCIRGDTTITDRAALEMINEILRNTLRARGELAINFELQPLEMTQFVTARVPIAQLVDPEDAADALGASAYGKFSERSGEASGCPICGRQDSHVHGDEYNHVGITITHQAPKPAPKPRGKAKKR